MTNIDIEAERLRFEVFLLKEFWSQREFQRYPHGGYISEYTSHVWDGWLAAKREAATGEFICMKCGLRTDAESSGDSNF